MQPTFPLLRLPNDERLAVLRQMKMDQDPLLKPPYDWKKEEYEVKDWLEHACTIFHQKNYDLVFDQDAFYFDIDSINEHFKNPNGLYLSATGNANYDHQSCIEPYHYTVIGGREIRRMDGTVARIQIDDELMTFNLFIWHEHNHC
ncbi:hypothetical protein CAEBREN_07402 [Caenorhabditis brenneri]|uniref:Uncharacterized protein n=1 Tax=Caenorhabditis brenneri TaxID=135651 RepID=G0N0A1_CAEBE|nr:hypothetical protein CAEBREN_07402 [Caenorhabditis brenneri]